MFEGQVRTFKHQLEHRFGLLEKGERLPTDHPWMQWLVLWACEILTKFRSRPSDG